MGGSLLTLLLWPQPSPCADLQRSLCQLPGVDCDQVQQELEQSSLGELSCQQHLDLLLAWQDMPTAWRERHQGGTLARLLSTPDGARLLSDLLLYGEMPLPSPAAGDLIPP